MPSPPPRALPTLDLARFARFALLFLIEPMAPLGTIPPGSARAVPLIPPASDPALLAKLVSEPYVTRLYTLLTRGPPSERLRVGLPVVAGLSGGKGGGGTGSGDGGSGGGGAGERADGGVGFQELLWGLARMRKGTPRQRIRVCAQVGANFARALSVSGSCAWEGVGGSAIDLSRCGGVLSPA